MKTHGRIWLGLAATLTTGCGGGDSNSGDDPPALPVSTVVVPAPLDPEIAYAPGVAADELSPEITNPLLPYPPGARWTFEGDTDAGRERIEIVVDAAPRNVWGTTVRVVRDTAFVDDVMVEQTDDWFAQDAAGNVWYLGEDTHEYENGVAVSDEGSWASGVDGALPGVNMLAVPVVGAVYRQEFYAGEAEDYAIVIAVDEPVAVPAGTFTGCIKTKERSVIDSNLDEFKYFCPGVGLTLEVDGEQRIELVTYSGL